MSPPGDRPPRPASGAPASGSDERLRRDDAAARRLAQSVFDRPLVLEAGAGTGKTTALVNRILGWCLGAGWDAAEARLARRAEGRRGEGPGGESAAASRTEAGRVAVEVLSGVVAITFTEAAAAEMAARVAGALGDVAAGREERCKGFDPTLLARPLFRRERARALAGALDHLTVQTIHAWCLGLLARHPLELGLHPRLEVDAEGHAVEEVARAVVEERLEAAYRQRDPAWLALAERHLGPDRIAAAVADALALGLDEETLARDPFAPEPLAAALGELDRGLAALAGEASVFAPLPDRQLAPRLLAAVGRTRRSLAEPPSTDGPGSDRADPAEGCGEAGPGEAGQGEADPAAARARRIADAVADAWPDNLLHRLGAWERGRLTAGEERLAGQAREALARAAAAARPLLARWRGLDVELLEVARSVLAPLVGEASRRLVARGVITFPQLLRQAHRLLRDRRAPLAALRRRVDQLLVDEFQDTDRLQCDLVRALALEGRGADRPGLFVVGDPKQSIYGWRDADLAAYEGLVEEIEAAGGERHRLSRNFRSRPAILDEVARAVEPVMIASPGLQPAFSPLLPEVDPAPADAPPEVEHWIAWEAGEEGGPATSADAAAELEARAVARDLRRLADERGAAWRDFAVLLRSSGRVDTFLAALREAEVPVVVAKDRGYYRRREVIEAAALVRAVLDPLDQIALVAWLRSAAVGVPDAALLPLWRRAFPDLVADLGRPGRDPGRDPGRHPEDALREAVAAAADEVGRLPVPGLGRIAGWPDALADGLDGLAALRRAHRRLPWDRFLEALRRRTLFEASEGARYLGRYRLANLERFFRELEAAMADAGGSTAALLRGLRRDVSRGREVAEALPKEAAEDAVRILTIHAAKGLEFPFVYLAQLGAETRGEGAPAIDADERWRPGEPRELALFGAPTLGFAGVERRRAEVAAAEAVRTLYVAMTRAGERLVLAGRWPAGEASEPPPEPMRAASFQDLLAHRAPGPPPMVELWERCRERGEATTRWGGVRWRFLGLDASDGGEEGAARPAATARRAGELAPADWVEAARADSLALADAGRRARRRMRKPLVGTASEEAAWERGGAATGEAPGPAPGPAPRPAAGPAPGPTTEGGATEGQATGGGATDLAARAALAAGRGVHRLLERWDLAADPEAELARQRELLPSYLPPPGALLGVGGDASEAAARRAADLLDRLAAGPLLGRLVDLAPHVLARELPVLLPGPEGAPGPIAGVVDLLYRHPAGGHLVVADHKTDVFGPEDDPAARAAAYRPQGEVYRRAVAEALGEEEVGFEVWFVAAGVVVQVDP